MPIRDHGIAIGLHEENPDCGIAEEICPKFAIFDESFLGPLQLRNNHVDDDLSSACAEADSVTIKSGVVGLARTGKSFDLSRSAWELSKIPETTAAVVARWSPGLNS
jgi:hypothetical protein